MFLSQKLAVMSGDAFRDNYSIAFDGTDGHIALENNANLYVNDADWSIAFWFKSTTTENDYFYSGGDGSDQGYIEFRLRGDDGGYIRAFLKDMDNTQELAFNTTVTGLNDGKWHHYAYTLDWSAKKGYSYVDGVFSAAAANTNVVTFANDADVVHIGKRSTTTSGTYELNGNISDMAIYNKFLSAEEVREVYNDGQPYNHNDSSFQSNLKGWWRMGDGAEDYLTYIGDDSSLNTEADVVVNGGFKLDVSWTKGTGWSISGGKAVCSGSQHGNTALTQTNAAGFLDHGAWYKVQFEISDYTAGEINPHITGQSSGNVSGNGIKISLIQASSLNEDIVMYADASFAAKIDNISIHKISGSPGIMKSLTIDDIEEGLS